MIISNLLLTLVTLLAVPTLSLNSSPAPSDTMSELTIETMKLLLAEQAQFVLSELKLQVKNEVTKQLEPHAARLSQLQDAQINLKKQLVDITEMLNFKYPPLSQHPPQVASITPISRPVSSTDATSVAPSTAASVSPLPLPDLKSIEVARRTLSFSPITDDLPGVNLAGVDILKMALHSFLINTMGISPTTVSKMVISKIWQHEVTYLNMISVEFSNMRSVSTIFKHVKNLLPGQKVSIFIPPVLDARYEELKTQSFHLRNGGMRNQTVIKYSGNNLALYTRIANTTDWELVNPAPPPHIDRVPHTPKAPNSPSRNGHPNLSPVPQPNSKN